MSVYYDLVGNLDWVQLPNGNYTTYSYDSQNRLRDQTNYVNNQPSAAVLSQYVYTMLADGQRKTSTENVWNPATSSYDTTPLVWDYDALNRLLSESRNGITTEQYVYDLVGNRLQKTTGSSTTHYFYNARNQLEKESLQSDGSTPTIQYEYDANGSLTRKYLGPDKLTAPLDILAYDLQGRLAEYQPHTGQAAAYTYNPDGIRTGKTVGTMATAYLVDPMNPTGYEQVLQSDDGVDKVYYVLGLDVIGQVLDSGDRAYYLYDGHGSVRQHADSAGDVGSDFNYDAYGNALNFVPDDGLYYTGEMYDVTAGQYYLRARYYEPENGRFNAVDSWDGNQEDPLSLHKYLYCHDDPINSIDPSGHIKLSPGLIKFFKGVGVYQGLKILTGIRATYVIGEDYQRTVNPKAKVNKWIATMQELPPEEWILDFMLRPDIVDENNSVVFEIKPDNERAIAEGRVQLAGYLPILSARYGKVMSPGEWPPTPRTYSFLNLPGMNLPMPFQLYVRNAGCGIIVYELFPSEEALVTAAALVELTIKVPKVYQAVQTAIQARVWTQTLITTYSGI